MSTYVYDIETYPNIFVANFIEVLTGQRHSFVIHAGRSDWRQLKQFLSRPDLTLVGYNNLRFDDVILSAMLMRHVTSTAEIATLASNIIEKAEIPDYWTYYNRKTWQSIDIMSLHRLRELGVSLKFLGVVLKHPIIQDLPIPPNTIVPAECYQDVIDYCFNDVEITLGAYRVSTEELLSRIVLSEIFDIAVYTDSRSGAAQRIMLNEYSKRTGVPVSDLRQEQTRHRSIALREVIGPNLVFHSPELRGLLALLEKLVVYKHIGEAKTENYYVTDAAGHTVPQHVTTKYTEGAQSFVVTFKDNFKAETKITYRGTTYKVGVGGLHSQDKPGHYVTDADHILMLVDVSSYYPSLQLRNKITPQHWGNFYLDILQTLTDERLHAKELSKHDPTYKRRAEAFKIVINSIFGRLGDEFSPLLDAMAMTSVTLSGQLYLLDLIEKIILGLPKAKIISANTDGIWLRIKRDELADLKTIGTAWADRLGLILDYEPYQSLYQRDVNNYLAIDMAGVVKTKGAFYPGELKDGVWTRPLDKGYDSPIVAIAIYRFLTEGISIRDTIYNHTDVYDFMIAKKVGSQFRTLYYHPSGEVERLQKTNRFLITKTGGSIVKQRIEDGTLENIVAGELAMVANRVTNPTVDAYPIRHGYYIEQAESILDTIMPPQAALLEF